MCDHLTRREHQQASTPPGRVKLRRGHEGVVGPQVSRPVWLLCFISGFGIGGSERPVTDRAKGLNQSRFDASMAIPHEGEMRVELSARWIMGHIQKDGMGTSGRVARGLAGS